MHMKKLKVLLIFLITLFPSFVYAYSEYIIPGGESIGINIKTEGILIVGFYKIDGNLNKGTPILKSGDIIIKVGDNYVNNEEDLVNAISKTMNNNEVKLLVRRGTETFYSDLNLIYSEGTYKTGLYIKDNISGIGTLSYIDPSTNLYGALGHEIVETNTNKRIEVKSGSIYESVVTGIDRSVRGVIGAKNAKFIESNNYGDILKNTIYGIYGNYKEDISSKEALKIKGIDEINKGEAYIYTVLDGNKKEKYRINITKLDKNSKEKNIYFEIDDERLLEEAGGIVQGMSGSPIIQGDNLIGVVTHVVISNPKSGYGIDIVSMLEEGEK